jgi:predicted MFS family arabinose efflux permease
LLLALSTVNQRGWSNPAVMAMLAWTAVWLAAFVVIERRAPEPLLPPALFSIPSFRLSVVAVFFLGMGLFGMFLYLPLYLQAVLGMSAAASGSLFTPLVFAMIGASVVSGQIVSRTGRYKVIAVLGALGSASGMMMLALLGADATTSAIVFDLVIVGLGFGCVQPIYNLVIQNSAPRAQIGAATASSQFFRSIGSTIGVAVFGTTLLAMYHSGLAAAMPAGTPTEVAKLFDNPLEVARSQSMGTTEMSAVTDTTRLMPALIAASRNSLANGMHTIFIAAGAAMVLTLLLTLFLPEVPLRSKAQPTES